MSKNNPKKDWQHPRWMEGRMWLRVLYFDLWFRIMLACVVLVGGVILLSIPKLWVATPPGFSPMARISLLDRVQAWRSRREFLPSARRGQMELAMRYLQQSLNYNPGDIASVRQCLGWFAEHPPEKAAIASTIPSTAAFLLHLGGTNAADVALVGRAMASIDEDSTVFDTLYPIRANLDATGRLRLLRACLFSKHWDEFDEVENLGADTSSEGVLLRHVRAAIVVGPPGSKGCVDEVKKARPQMPSERIYTRLLLIASLAAMDANLCRDTIDRLRDLHALRVDDEAKYWRLVYALGNKDEAFGMVRSRLESASDPAEAETLAQAAVELGLGTEAVDFLGRILAVRPELINLRLLDADIMVGQSRWKDLGETALALRGERSNSGLRDLSYLFEAVAEAGQGRLLTAREALQRVDPARIFGPRFAIECAQSLEQNGLASETVSFLKAVKERCQTEPSYWTTLISAAQKGEDLDFLVNSAREAHERWPKRSGFASSYAAALLATHRDPATALELARGLHSDQPQSKSRHLAYVYALVQSEKWAESKRELSLIEGPFDSPKTDALNDIIRFELAWRTGDSDGAEKIAERISTTNLPHSTIAWLAEARKKIRQSRGG